MARHYSIPTIKRGGEYFVRGTNVRLGSKRGIALSKAWAKARRAEVERAQGRAPGARFRIQDSGTWQFRRTAKKASERFDEIAVDGWLHVEACDNRSFYGSIGGLTLWWTINRKGECTFTHAEIREPFHALPGAFVHVLERLAR